MWPFMRGARNSRIKLMKFGLQMLIDEQQSLQCSAHVTIASCDDVFDSNFSPFGSHTNPLHNHAFGLKMIKVKIKVNKSKLIAIK